MSLSTYYLEYDRHLARLHRRRRRRRAYAPTSNTASHDNHEKITSWVTFSFLYGYWAPLSGPLGRWSSAVNNQIYVYGGKRHKKPTCSTYTIITVSKTDAILFSPTSSAQCFFHFHFILHRPHAKTPFSEWTVEYLLFNLLQVFCHRNLLKSSSFEPSLHVEKSTSSKMTPRLYKQVN